MTKTSHPVSHLYTHFPKRITHHVITNPTFSYSVTDDTETYSRFPSEALSATCPLHPKPKSQELGSAVQHRHGQVPTAVQCQVELYRPRRYTASPLAGREPFGNSDRAACSFAVLGPAARRRAAGPLKGLQAQTPC